MPVILFTIIVWEPSARELNIIVFILFFNTAVIIMTATMTCGTVFR